MLGGEKRLPFEFLALNYGSLQSVLPPKKKSSISYFEKTRQKSKLEKLLSNDTQTLTPRELAAEIPSKMLVGRQDCDDPACLPTHLL